MNYYNDNDKFSSKWLSELADDNLIPKGTIDDRSITDVRADDLRYTQCHFFAGIGGWPRALELAGWDSTWPVWSMSLPCQPFSCAGKGKAKADDRHLWPVAHDLIEKEKPQTLVGEQVQSKDAREWFDGKEKILQAVSDRETIVRVLQIRGTFGDLPPEMQRMLQGRGAREKKPDPEGRKVKVVQGTPSEKQGAASLSSSKESGEKEGLGLLFGQSYRPPPRCHRCGRLRINRDTVQSKRGKNVGQPKPRQGGLFEGVYSDQCACGALLRKCDGESVGRKQNSRDIQCDNGSQALSLRGISEQIRIRFEATHRHRSISGVRPDLEALGYRVAAADLPAASVGSPHKRNRLFWCAVGNTSRKGLEGRIFNTAEQAGLQGNVSGPNVPTGRLADSESIGRREGQQDATGGNERGCEKQGAESIGGFWSNSTFIPCADGKYRRVPGREIPWFIASSHPRRMGNSSRVGLSGINGRRSREVAAHRCQPIEAHDNNLKIEPLLFPLADGVQNRVGILRGAGNSIVPQVAAEFVKSVMECI